MILNCCYGNLNFAETLSNENYIDLSRFYAINTTKLRPLDKPGM